MRVYRLDILRPSDPLGVAPIYRIYQGIGKLFNNSVAPNIEFDVPAYIDNKSTRFELTLYNIQKYWSAQDAQRYLWGKRIVVRGGIAKTPTTDRIGLDATPSDIILAGQPLFQGYIHLALPEVNRADWIWRVMCYITNPITNWKLPFNFSVKKGSSYASIAKECYYYFENKSVALEFNNPTQISTVDIKNKSIGSSDELNSVLQEYFGDNIRVKQGNAIHLLKISEMIGQPQMLSHASVEFTVVMNAKYRIGDIITTDARFFIGLNKIFDNYQAEMPDGILSRAMTRNGGVFSFFANRAWRIYEIIHRGKSRNPAPESWVTIIKATDEVWEQQVRLYESTKREPSQSVVANTKKNGLNTSMTLGL